MDRPGGISLGPFPFGPWQLCAALQFRGVVADKRYMAHEAPGRFKMEMIALALAYASIAAIVKAAL